MLVWKGRSERLFLPCDQNSLRMAQGTNGMVWRAGPTTWAKCYGGWKCERKGRLRTKSVFLLKLHILQHLWGDPHDAEETRTHHFLSDNPQQYLRSTSLLWAPHHTYFNFKTTSCVCKSAESQLIVAGNKTQTGVGTSSKHTQGCSRYTDPPAAAAVTTSSLCSLSQLSSTTDEDLRLTTVTAWRGRFLGGMLYIICLRDGDDRKWGESKSGMTRSNTTRTGGVQVHQVTPW